MSSRSHRPEANNVTVSEFADLRRQIDARLEELLPSEAGTSVASAMHDCLLSGGKRVRPSLLILAAHGLGHDSPALLDLGCAVEMVHSASLILDDLPCMDDASLRRGRPTTHRQYGEDVAMLSMVALLSRAFGLVSAAPGVPSEVRAQMVAKLSWAVGEQGLVKGQYQDLHAPRQRRDVNDVTTTNTLKTGVLFQATLALAGLAAGAPEIALSRLQRFALALGQAYQLYDDLTDGLAVNGNDAGQDRGKATLIALLGEDEVRQRLADYLADADRHLAAIFGADPPLSRFMHALFSRFDHQLGLSLSQETMPLPVSRL